MSFDPELVHEYYNADVLESSAAKSGLSTSDMEYLLESELDTDQLLSYIKAVISKRMN